MKAIYAATMLLSLVGVSVLTFLGVSWIMEGHGLHPAVCGLGGCLFASAGWHAAGQIED